MTMYSNPIAALVNDARSIQASLAEDAAQMALAIEQRHFAQQACKTAKEAYDAAEAETLFDFTFNDEAYRAAKNAEQREIIKDQMLVKARSVGSLAYPWRILNECRTGLDNAQMAYDQCEARFKAVRVAAELQASMLIALTADAKSSH